MQKCASPWTPPAARARSGRSNREARVPGKSRILRPRRTRTSRLMKPREKARGCFGCLRRAVDPPQAAHHPFLSSSTACPVCSAHIILTVVRLLPFCLITRKKLGTSLFTHHFHRGGRDNFLSPSNIKSQTWSLHPCVLYTNIRCSEIAAVFAPLAGGHRRLLRHGALRTRGRA